MMTLPSKCALTVVMVPILALSVWQEPLKRSTQATAMGIQIGAAFLRIALSAPTQPQTGSGASSDKSPDEFNDLLHFQRREKVCKTFIRGFDSARASNNSVDFSG